MERTETFNRWMKRVAYIDEVSESYEWNCENARSWLESNRSDVRTFREELAAHIRDSSYAPNPALTQWMHDEHLRNLWFDLFGPEPPPGDPYPVPQERWGRHRMTNYMRDLPPERSGELHAPIHDWLAARGVTFDDLAAYHAPGAERDYSRPEPAGYRKRLAELAAEGRRSGPAEGEHAEAARAELRDTKQMYRDTGHPEAADQIDRIIEDSRPRD